MLTRRRRAPRPSNDTASHCRLCGTAVSVDHSGRCRLGHQVVATVATVAAEAAEAGVSAPVTSVEDETAPRRVTASPLDALMPQPKPAPESPAPTSAPVVEDAPAAPPVAPAPQSPGPEAPAPASPAAATSVPASDEGEAARARLLEASSWFTDG